MARIKRSLNARKKHKKVLKQAKGYYGAKSKLFKVANQAVMKSMTYAFIGRKRKKRDFRSLWIARINAGTRQYGLSYSKFMYGLKKNNMVTRRREPTPVLSWRDASKRPTSTASARNTATSLMAGSGRCQATRTRVRCRGSGSSLRCRWVLAR